MKHDCFTFSGSFLLISGTILPECGTSQNAGKLIFQQPRSFINNILSHKLNTETSASQAINQRVAQFTGCHYNNDNNNNNHN